MLVAILVFVGLAIFALLNGYYIIAVLMLAGFSKKIGFIALFIASVAFMLQGHYIIGVLPILVIAWNIVGELYLAKR